MRIEAVLVLDLEVIVGGEEGELDRLEEPLQIRLAGRGDERGLPPQRPLYGKRGIRSSHGSLDVHTISIAVTLLDLHDGAEGIASACGESTSVEIYLSDKVGVDHPHAPPRSTLSREVIDHGDLYAIKIEDILRGAPTTHDEVIAIGVCRSYTWQPLYELGDISIRSGTLLDLLEAQRLYGERALGTFESNSGTDNDLC